jgi:predicted TIM-barrel fold metal-dependent hydrolase
MPSASDGPQLTPAYDPGQLAVRLADAPLVDQHCHSLIRGWRSVGELNPAWRRCFTEATQAASLERDVPTMRGYAEFVRAFARHLDVQVAGSSLALEREVARWRDERAGSDGYVRQLFDDARVGTLLIDTGYPGANALGAAELETLTGRAVRTVVRVESIAEQVLARRHRSWTPAAFREAVRAAIEDELAAGAVALKTVAAYRCGLDLPEPTATDVRRALADADDQTRRLDDPALVALVVRTAAAIAQEANLPLQIHTGFGDDDLHLPASDPTLLRSLLRDAQIAGGPIVLLHCHPFVAQAAYLASTYPGVHVDLSLTIPLLGARGARAAISQALGLCPTSKLLAGTDGHSYPEMHWRGAHLWREALTAVLDDEVRGDRLDIEHAEEIARLILAGNARRLYRLD